MLQKWFNDNGIQPIIPENRSKCEQYFQNVLDLIFHNLHIEYNNRKILNPYEIDIWIDSLKLGFEINGGMHYKPAFGPRKDNKMKHFNHVLLEIIPNY